MSTFSRDNGCDLSWSHNGETLAIVEHINPSTCEDGIRTVIFVDRFSGLQQTYTVPQSLRDNSGIGLLGWVQTQAQSTLSVDSLTLVNADSDTDLFVLSDGTTITLNQPPINDAEINVRANASGTVGSIVFDLDGTTDYRTENVAPYTIAGVSGSDYLPWDISLGIHTLTATPYSDPNGTGTAGTPLTVTFTLTESSVSCDTTVPASDVSGLVTAINTANGSGSADTICLEASTYTLFSHLPRHLWPHPRHESARAPC